MSFKNMIFNRFSFNQFRVVDSWMVCICLLQEAAVIRYAPHTFFWGAVYGVVLAIALDHACNLIRSLIQHSRRKP